MPMHDSAERATKVSAFFGEHAANWRGRYAIQHFDHWDYQTRARIALEWLETLHRSGNRRLLELGCGAGVQSVAAARQGWDVVSVDFAAGMLAEAKQQSDEPAWVAAAVEALPFRPRSYDVVLMNGVIGYVKDPQQALRIVRDQLRPGGTLIISWASPHPLLIERVSRIVSWLPDAAYLGLKRLVTGRRRVTEDAEPGFYQEFLRRWRPEQFYALLVAAGFTVGRVRSQNFGRFRFMDRLVWPARADMAISAWLAWLAGAAPHRRLRDGARTHIAFVTA